MLLHMILNRVVWKMLWGDKTAYCPFKISQKWDQTTYCKKDDQLKKTDQFSFHLSHKIKKYIYTHWCQTTS